MTAPHLHHAAGRHRHPPARQPLVPIPARAHQLSRRVFLTELSRRTFAVTILGAAVVSCGGDDRSGGRSSNTSGSPASGSEPTDGSAASSTSAAALPALTWERVNLGFVSAYVLVRGNTAAVVDTGVAGSERQIGQTLVDLGLNWGDVDHVVLTHLHPDHAGSVGPVMDSATSATAYAGEADIASIDAPRAITAVGDGDDVFGMQVISTPGHTLGHISILDAETGLLVVGDAMNRTVGPLAGSNPERTADASAAVASVEKLAGLDFDTAVFGHGDPIEGGAQAEVAALAATL